MAIQIINLGIFLCLIAQLDALARHNRQGSFRTKDRYYEAMKRFCAFLADHFHLQKLANISGKHLVAYVLYQELIDKGVAPLDAHFQVSRLLGHERPDVTDIYLASVQKEGSGDGK